jgi:hypothetical protein
MPRGPFGGLFDNIACDNPWFFPWLVLSILLASVWLATAWFLLRHRLRRPRMSGNGFEILLKRGIDEKAGKRASGHS